MKFRIQMLRGLDIGLVDLCATRTTEDSSQFFLRKRGCNAKAESDARPRLSDSLALLTIMRKQETENNDFGPKMEK